jgi:hypothetical protein
VKFSGAGFRVASKVGREGSLDFYRFELKEPSTVRVRVRTKRGDLLHYFFLAPPSGGSGYLDSTTTRSDKDITMSAYADTPGTYYLIVGGARLLVGKGAEGADEDGFRQTVGKYLVEVKTAEPDVDTFSVMLGAGDVFAGTVSRGDNIKLIGSTGTESITSSLDVSGNYPAASPLPGGDGNPHFSFVVRAPGQYYVEVGSGRGSCSAQLEVHRYGGSTAAQTRTVFLDTDGGSG